MFNKNIFIINEIITNIMLFDLNISSSIITKTLITEFIEVVNLQN